MNTINNLPVRHNQNLKQKPAFGVSTRKLIQMAEQAEAGKEIQAASKPITERLAEWINNALAPRTVQAQRAVEIHSTTAAPDRRIKMKAPKQAKPVVDESKASRGMRQLERKVSKQQDIQETGSRPFWTVIGDLLTGKNSRRQAMQGKSDVAIAKKYEIERDRAIERAKEQARIKAEQEKMALERAREQAKIKAEQDRIARAIREAEQKKAKKAGKEALGIARKLTRASKVDMFGIPVTEGANKTDLKKQISIAARAVEANNNAALQAEGHEGTLREALSRQLSRYDNGKTVILEGSRPENPVKVSQQIADDVEHAFILNTLGRSSRVARIRANEEVLRKKPHLESDIPILDDFPIAAE